MGWMIWQGWMGWMRWMGGMDFRFKMFGCCPKVSRKIKQNNLKKMSHERFFGGAGWRKYCESIWPTPVLGNAILWPSTIDTRVFRGMQFSDRKRERKLPIAPKQGENLVFSFSGVPPSLCKTRRKTAELSLFIRPKL